MATVQLELSEAPGLGTLSIPTLLAELGPDLSAFPTDKHSCSWLGLCPDPRISGDRVLSSHTLKVAKRAAHVVRMAAQSLWHSRSFLAGFYRKMRARLCPAAANTAAAHKLARIFYHLLTTGVSYSESVFVQEQERQHRERRLSKEAIALGCQLVNVFNYKNLKQAFDDFEFSGVNNFDFFAYDYLNAEMAEGELDVEVGNLR